MWVKTQDDAIIQCDAFYTVEKDNGYEIRSLYAKLGFYQSKEKVREIINEIWTRINMRSHVHNGHIHYEMPKEHIPGRCEIQFSGTPTLRSCSCSSKLLTARFYDGNNDLIKMKPTWRVTSSDEDACNIWLDYPDSDDSIKIKTKSCCGTKITVTVSAEDPEYGYFEKTVVLNVVSLF
jgi:hypothetical protein